MSWSFIQYALTLSRVSVLFSGSICVLHIKTKYMYKIRHWWGVTQKHNYVHSFCFKLSAIKENYDHSLQTYPTFHQYLELKFFEEKQFSITAIALMTWYELSSIKCEDAKQMILHYNCMRDQLYIIRRKADVHSMFRGCIALWWTALVTVWFENLIGIYIRNKWVVCVYN